MLIDWFTVAAQAINFLILVWLLKRYLYKPVLAAIDEREKRIAKLLQDAEMKKAEALKEQADFAHKNEEFENQRSALLMDATNAAKTERDKLFQAARKDSDDLRVKLEKAVEAGMDNLNQKLGTLAQDQVFSVTRKTLADLADVSLEERMTDLFLRKVHDMPDQDRNAFKSSEGASKPALIRSAFELGPAQRTALEQGVRPLLPDGTNIEFETKPDLISGIELTSNGQKIAWTISGYLASLNEAVEKLLAPKSDPAPVVDLKVLPHAA
jgi:F-type H+-transporting ATPase subunit b